MMVLAGSATYCRDGAASALLLMCVSLQHAGSRAWSKDAPGEMGTLWPQLWWGTLRAIPSTVNTEPSTHHLKQALNMLNNKGVASNVWSVLTSWQGLLTRHDDSWVAAPQGAATR